MKLVGWRLLLALGSALLFGLYARFPSASLLSFSCLVPWVLLYTDDRAPRVPFGYWILGAYLTWPALHPVAARWGPGVPFGMGLFFFIAWLPFAPALRRVHHRLGLPRSVSVAILWTATEFVRATFGFAHWDVFGLGYAQARFTWLIQIVDITGVYGVSLWCAAVNGWIADLIFAIRDGSEGLRGAIRQRRIVGGAIGILAALVLFLAYGALRTSTIVHEDGPRVAIVQPNVPHTQQNMAGVHMLQLVQSERGIPAGEADLIVWPENSVMDDLEREPLYLEDLAWLAERKDAWVLLGALGRAEEYPGKTTNNAFLVDRDGRIRQTYAKQVLFPWGEYIPLDRVAMRWFPPFAHLHRLVTRLAWGFQPTGEPGDETVQFELPWSGGTARFATMICVENAYPPIAAAAGRRDIDFLLNITSEGHAGGPIQEQFLRIAITRAVEQRASYVRAGNDGISGVIDATGRMRAILQGENGATVGTPGVLIATVPIANTGTSFYARSRDAFVLATVALAVVLLVWPRRRPGPGATSRAAATATIAIAAAVVTSACTGPPPLGTDTDRVAAALERGRQAVTRGNRKVALASFTTACATEEGCRLALAPLARLYEAGKSDDAAVELFTRIIERYPSLEPDARIVRGSFYERILDMRAAERDYLEAAETDPSARAFGRIGNLRLRLVEFAGAADAFRRGLEYAPDDPALRLSLARALRLTDDLTTSREMLETLVEEHPELALAWVQLGRTRWSQGEREPALEACRIALRLDPDNIQARLVLARHAVREGDLATVDRLTGEIRAIEESLGRGPRTRF